MRMPVQRFDALQDMLVAHRSPSALATFTVNLGGPRSMGGTALLRPLKYAQIKALFDLSRGHYWLAFRAFHAFLLISVVLLFVHALAVRTWPDVAAATFALTVLTGMYTFAGTVREAFPLNHQIEIVVSCLLALVLVRSRGGWLVDLALGVILVAASLTLESGVLVWVVVVAAWLAGAPGASRRSVAIVTGLLAAYLVSRVFVFQVTAPVLSERNSGFLLEMLEGGELARRFGDNPMWFYAYNVVSSFMSLLFSEPQSGVFEVTRRWLEGDVPPRIWIGLASSVACTALIAAAAVSRWRGRFPAGRERDRELFLVCGAMLAANAVLSYAYTKDEILSPAGACYAGAAFAAARWAIDGWRPRGRVAGILVCLALFGLTSLWAFRSAGLHHTLRVQAFKHRNDWARLTVIEAPEGPAENEREAALLRQLRREAIDMPVPTPDLFGPAPNRWWGE
jgi:hypothetical protein